jgi:MbtH protein
VTTEDVQDYQVVMNAEEQYSIWRSNKPIPPGWSAVGKHGPRRECLTYIESVWTDMRPLSLQRRMARDGASSSQKLN